MILTSLHKYLILLSCCLATQAGNYLKNLKKFFQSFRPKQGINVPKTQVITDCEKIKIRKTLLWRGNNKRIEF